MLSVVHPKKAYTLRSISNRYLIPKFKRDFFAGEKRMPSFVTRIAEHIKAAKIKL